MDEVGYVVVVIDIDFVVYLWIFCGVVVGDEEGVGLVKEFL